MTRAFNKTLDRLARAWNYNDGSYLLITQCGDDDGVVQSGGDSGEIVNGIITALKLQILPNVDDDEARDICDWLKSFIVEDEERRFQEAGE